MDTEFVIAVACFAGVVLIISVVVIIFLILCKKMECSYVDKMAGKPEMLDVMEKDTIFERMVQGGRVLQYITILGAFSAVFFLAILEKVSAEIAATIIGMIITGVIGAEAGTRLAGESKKKTG